MDNTKIKLLQASAVTIIALSGVAATPAYSQSEASTVESDATIIVTAQKSNQSLDDVAASIIIAEGEELAAAGIQNATDLDKAIAGVSVSALGTVVNLNVRGVSSAQYSPLGGSSVGFVMDGVPLEGNLGVSTGFYDLARVEVLKGPQGTLYGLNATGGVISVISARPEIGRTYGGLDIEAGNLDYFKTTGFVNGALGENVAARLSGTYNRRDGTIQNVFNDADQGGFRGQLLLDESTWSLLFAGDYFHQGGVGQVTIPLPYGARGTDPGDPYDQHYYSGDPTDAYIDHTYWGVRAELNADLGFADLLLLPSYREIHTDEIAYQASYRGDVKSDVWQTSVEARLSGEIDSVSWLLGGYLFWGERKYDGFFFNPDNATPFDLPLESYFDGPVAVVNGVYSITPKDSQAVFGQATWSASDNFRLIGGLRYSRDRRAAEPNTDFTLNYTGGPADGPPPNVIPISVLGPIMPAPGESLSLAGLTALDPDLVIVSDTAFQSATFENVDFKVGVQFDLTPGAMLYANVSTGYKAGGVNPYSSATVSTAYEPEELTAYDVGARVRFGDLRLHVNGFYWDYRNHQEGAIYQTDAGIKLLIQNLPKGELYGADFELDWRPTPNDTLSAQVAWLESDTGPFTVGEGASAFVEPTGHEYVSAPRWTINGSYEHIFELGEYELVAKATGHYQSASNLEIRFTDATAQDDYFTGDAFLTFRPASGDWYLGGYVRNFSDTTYLPSASKAPGPGDNYWGFLNLPRTYGLRAGLTF